MFRNTTVVNADPVQNDVALAVVGDKIAAIGPTEQVLKTYPNADVYDGRGKALFPGLINCHAHLTATLQRGFNEDFGFPNSAKLPVQPGSLLQGEEATLMTVIGALEAIRTGTTTFVENAGNIGRYAGALSKTGLRWVFAESIRDSENVPGPLSPDGLAKSETPRFSQKLREEGMQRINDLFSAWHGKNSGRISVFPAAALTETSSPELLRDVRAFADKHDLGYTIHLNQSIAEYEFMVKFHETASGGISRSPRLPGAAPVRGPRALCRRRRDRAAWQDAARSFRIRPTWRRTAASSRRFRRCVKPAARSRSAPTTTPTTCSR